MEPDKIIAECSFVVGVTRPAGLKYDCAGALLTMSGWTNDFDLDKLWPGKVGTFNGKKYQVDSVTHTGHTAQPMESSFIAREIQIS